MPFDQQQYINEFNKQTYKMFPLRVRKSNEAVLQKLSNTRNKNKYIVSLIEKDINPDVLTLKQIKERLFPILKNHNINDVYLFGSYARGEANNNSGVDIYCEHGDIRGLFDMSRFKDELEQALGKEVDLVFIGSEMDEYFEKQMKEDLIKLC